MEVNIKSNAKINIGLNVLRKREDGYHDLEMIMAPIDLYDNINIVFNKKKGNLKIIDKNSVGIPIDKNNIIYKIYEEFYNYTRLEREEIIVNIEKNIPFSAGLGGGSGNGGTFLLELNKYYNNFLSIEKLINISKKVGADIPFFIYNKTAIVTGIGEKIEVFNSNLECAVILIKPNFGINTKYAYECLKNLKSKNKYDILKIKEGMENNKLEQVINNIGNNIRDGLIECDKNVLEFENKLLELENIKFFMSGSGSCYYTLSIGRETESIYNKLKDKFCDCFISINRFL